MGGEWQGGKAARQKEVFSNALRLQTVKRKKITRGRAGRQIDMVGEWHLK